MKTLGILLIAAGILMMIFRGFNFTQNKKVVDLGPVEINKKESKHIGWPVYAGAVIIVAGIVILVNSRKGKSL